MNGFYANVLAKGCDKVIPSIHDRSIMNSPHVNINEFYDKKIKFNRNMVANINSMETMMLYVKIIFSNFNESLFYDFVRNDYLDVNVNNKRVVIEFIVVIVYNM
nr:hypothetical protein TnSNPV_99 [Trichoplusia ni single nucleopolyhedrovirus]